MTLDGFTLRAALPADVPYLLALRRQTMTEHWRATGREPTEEEHRSRVLYRFECAQIVEQEGTPVGLFKVAREGSTWKLIQIQVDPALQGRGVGAALIRQLIAEATMAKATLELHVLRQNPARHLYERLGFQVVGEGTYELAMRHVGAPAP